MTEATEVLVTELTPEHPIVKNAKHGTVLGNKVIEAKLVGIWADGRRDSRVFLLEWTGSNVPHGAVVGGREITYTQSSQVISHNQRIGTYDRIVDGPAGGRHKMLVYLRS